MSINNVVLLGRLVRDPELRHTEQGTSVASFTLAVDSGKDREAYFIDCTAWKSTADFINTWFHKGTKIALSGKIQTRTWTGRDGNKRKATEVVALNVEFAESKRDGAESGAPNYGTPSGDQFAELADDDGDLPF